MKSFEQDLNGHRDYLAMRKAYCDEVLTNKTTWANFSNEEKQRFIDLFLNDPNLNADPLLNQQANDQNKVIFLMGLGYSQAVAQQVLVDSYSEHHVFEIEACTARANASKSTAVVIKYLNISDARDFIETTKSLYDLYADQGIKGVNDGSVGEGLFDFIESTVGTSFEFLGLEQQGYTLKGGTWSTFKAELMDILRNGNY